jgi:protein-arginine kinase activator protein McsA
VAPEVGLLRTLLDALALKLPASQRLEIERRLREAVMSENYELAAILRNELRMMEGGA